MVALLLVVQFLAEMVRRCLEPLQQITEGRAVAVGAAMPKPAEMLVRAGLVKFPVGAGVAEAHQEPEPLETPETAGTG